MLLLYLFLIGLVMGSFFTVIGIRGPLNESFINSRSHCDNCKKTLKWYELLPIISWIIQGGRCNKCHSKIPVTYPIIELLTGFLFALSYYLYGISYEFFAMIVISSLLIIILVSDFKYLVILDAPLFISCILILVLKWYYFGLKTFIFSLLSGLILFLFMFLIKLIGDKVFKRESLGGGDIKLAVFFGFTLGIRLSFMSLVLGSFLAFPYALYFVIKSKEKEIPFGPFLMIGMLVIFLLQSLITDFINLIL